MLAAHAKDEKRNVSIVASACTHQRYSQIELTDLDSSAEMLAIADVFAATSIAL